MVFLGLEVLPPVNPKKWKKKLARGGHQKFRGDNVSVLRENGGRSVDDHNTVTETERE